MIAAQLAVSELLIIVSGVAAVLMVGPTQTPAEKLRRRRRLRAYRRFCRDLDAEEHIAWAQDLLPRHRR